MADARTVDPPFVGKFKFEVGPDEIGFFTEVSGLSVQIDVEDLAEGGQNAFTHKLLGRMKWPNLVFKRGITNTDNLFKWLMQFSGEGFTNAGNMVVPLDGSITILDPTGQQPVRVWSFREAKPVRWSGPKLAASSKDLAVEELEVCHCGFTSGP